MRGDDVVAACMDADGDGFGIGCDTGRDCDDASQSVTNDCPVANCAATPNAPSCACDDQGLVIDCGEAYAQFENGVVCGFGIQVCDEGKWSGCRISSLPGQIIQSLRPNPNCPTNPCDPGCMEFLGTPGYTANPTGAIACSADPTCQDGVQNQGENGIDCEGPCVKACGQIPDLINETFAGGGGFTYNDDTFRGTNAPSSESGVAAGGVATVTLGQVTGSGPNSGGMRQQFMADTPVNVSFDWTLDMDTAFLSDECGEVLVSIDGVLYGQGGNDYVAQQCNGGSQGGTFTFTSNALAAGQHTLLLGGFLNKNAGSGSTTKLEVEDYADYNNPTTDGNNAGRAGGDLGFETSADDGTPNFGWTSNAVWVEWSYNAPVDGNYSVNSRVAGGGASYWSHNILIDGVVVDTITGTNTGGWQSWVTVTGDPFAMTAGLHTVRMQLTSGDQNINFIEINEPAAGPQYEVTIDNVVVNAPTGAVCGDGTCAATENCTSCVSDCGACAPGPYCGDAVCGVGESCVNCESDCGVCLAGCGDAVCDAGAGEGCGTCETDCGTCVPGPVCGDATCDTGVGETCGNCETDCGECAGAPVCGDATCNAVGGESCSNCTADCGACGGGVVCGDAVCDGAGGEDCNTCISDCGDCAPGGCGDAVCDGAGGETCGTCSSDCGDCAVAGCGDGTCAAGLGEDCSTCAADCGVCATCGDTSCDVADGETCGTCPTDCGACAAPLPTELYLEAECPTTSAGYYTASRTNRPGSLPPAGHLYSNDSKTDPTLSVDRASYDVSVAATNYDVYFRVETNNSGSNDSWFFSWNGGSTWVTENGHSAAGAGFHWRKAAGGPFSLNSASELLVRNREQGLAMDRIAILPVGGTPSDAVTPTNCSTPAAVCGDATCSASENCTTCATDCAPCPATPGCGDAVCDGGLGETCLSCSSDCGACPPAVACGDSVCDAAGGESCSNCAADCGACPPSGCGDATCDAAGGETCSSCALDCAACADLCGDGVCGGAETCSTCASDCGDCAGDVCGDAACGPGETCSSCALDCAACGSGTVCGDGTCDATEDCSSCAADCAACPGRTVCGDAVCDTGETCSSCALDCTACPPGAVCGDAACDASEDCAVCATDCTACPATSTCGDGVCETDEDCTTCSDDCGVCIPMCAPPPPPPDPCGDSVCDPLMGEDCGICGADCGACVTLASCGDTSCDSTEGESCDTCPGDCGVCLTPRVCGDSICEPSIGESCSNCDFDCGACSASASTVCGDSVCEVGETCDSCSADCGGCPFFGTGDPFNGGIVTTGSVTLGDRVTVNGDVTGQNLVFGSQARVNGNASSEGNTELRSGAVVTGTLQVEGTFTQQSGASTGALEYPADVTVPTLPPVTANPGGSPRTINVDSNTSIAPGRYQALFVGARSRVVFTAGRYDFASVTLEPDVEIVLDVSSGPIEWRIASDFSVESRITWTVSDSSKFGIFSAGNILARPQSNFPSSLYAPNGTITIFSNSTVNGGIGAQNVILEPDITIGVGQLNVGWGSASPPPPTPPAPVCGDTSCTPETGESCSGCASDCGACEILAYCGDGTCNTDQSESCGTCAVDCGACVVTSSCGDGTCDASAAESCTSCAADCGACVAPVVCGNAACEVGEDCDNCVSDCGNCALFELSSVAEDFEMDDECPVGQEPLWAGFSWQATTPGDSRIEMYFRTAATLAELDAAPERLVVVAAIDAASGGYRYGPPAELGAMTSGFQYLDDVAVAEGDIIRSHPFSRMRFVIVPTSDGNQSPELLATSLQTSCRDNQ